MVVMAFSGISSALQQEWQSLQTPASKELAPIPQAGSPAPSSPLLKLPDNNNNNNNNNNRPTLLVFLRHCGCPCGFPLNLWHGLQCHSTLTDRQQSRKRRSAFSLSCPRATRTSAALPSRTQRVPQPSSGFST
jgi:hypothetical protein